MSNAMRMGKRTLAGVAAGALALGALSIAGATSASAKPNVKPKATKTATVTAVRATGVTSPLSIPEAKMSWTGAGSFTNGSALNVLSLTTAPTATAILTVDDSTGTGDDTATLGQTATSINFTSGDDSSVRFNVDTAGAYVGAIANGTDTVSFSFTTAGAPTSMSLTPVTQTVLVGGTATVTVTLKDASGNVTQPQTVDSVTLTSSGDDTVSVSPLLGTKTGALKYGTYDDTISTQTAGTSTLTATPLGTLPGTGVSTVTATLVKSGTVAAVPVVDMAVTVPTTAINSGSSVTALAAQIPENATSVTVLIDDTTLNAVGTQLRFKAVLSAGGTLNGAAATAGAPQYLNTTTDSKKQATLSLTLGGAAVLNGSQLTLTQVNVANTAVTNGGVLTITWKTPAVQGNSIIPTPSGNIVAKLGTSTTVSVLVDDSFGTAQSGWTVRSYRTSVGAANLLSSATTNASGTASVTVSPLASVVNGGSETYRFTAQAPVGGSEITADLTLVVTYTTDGGITSLSVTNGAGATACSTTSCTLVTYPVVTVPSGGVVSGTSSAQKYTVSSGALDAGAVTNMVTFTADASPNNAVTVTVPAGVKVSTTNPATTVTAWDGGSQSVTQLDNTAVYVWATKTGTHDIVFTSGGKTVTAKLRVVNQGADAYNIALTPDKQDLKTGSFGTLELKVTDAFGNIVDTSDDSGAVAMSVTGQVLFGGYTNSIASATTGAAGTYTATLIAASDVGAAVITAVPKTGTVAPAWATGYTKPTGFAAPVVSATAAVTVTSSSSKSITILDSGRTTVSGKPGVYAYGTTTGFTTGDTLKVWVKFPGQTDYTEGAAKPAIAADGTFEWSRKTGKKTYVYFSNNDGLVKSSSVIIPAA